MSSETAVKKKAKDTSPIILYRKDVSLLKHSLVTSDPAFQWVKNVLSRIDKRVRENDLRYLTIEQRAEFKSTVSRMLQIAAKEWKGDESSGGEASDYTLEPVKCSLCGRDNNYIYYIVNRHDESKKINVGSECFKKFDFDIGMDEAQQQKNIKEKKRLVCEIALDKEINGINEFVKSLNSFIFDLPIVIPQRISNKFDKTIGELQKHYYSFLDGKRGDTLDQIKNLSTKVQEEIDAIQNYVSTHKNDENIVTSKLLGWAKVNCKSDVVERLKQDGYLSPLTSQHIFMQQHLDRFVDKYSQITSSARAKVLMASESKKGYAVTFSDYGDTRFLITHRQLMENYGYSFYDIELDEYPTRDKLMEMAYPYSSSDLRDVYNTLLMRFNRMTSLLMTYYDEQYNEVVFRRFMNGKYHYWIDKLSSFIHRFKHLIFAVGDERFEPKDIREYLLSYNGRMFEEEDMRGQARRKEWDVEGVLGNVV